MMHRIEHRKAVWELLPGCMIRLAHFIGALLIGTSVRSQIPPGQFTNTWCDQAMPICGSLEYTHGPVSEPFGYACLWYRFTLENATYVGFETSGLPAFLVNQSNPGSCDCQTGTGGFSHTGNLSQGTYYVGFRFEEDQPIAINITVNHGIECPECPDCLPELLPDQGKVYVLNAWVKKEGAPVGTVNYGALASPPYLEVEAPVGTVIETIVPDDEYPVVEGWQLIEGRFTMPAASSIAINLKVDDGSALFDDIRLFPGDGSMKCYVYDPTNLRFVAELDERHFATFYEYDNAGKLVRVKKETERGIMTIQESRRNDSHVNQ